MGLEAVPQGFDHRLPFVEVAEHGRSGHRFNAADAGGHPRFADDLEQADLGGAGHVGAAAQFHRYPGNIHHPHHLAVLFAKHGHGAGGPGLVDRHFGHLQGVAFADPAVDQGFDCSQFLGRDGPGAVEIKTQAVEIHQGSGLGDGRIHHLLEGGLQQVGGRVVGLGAAAAGGIDAGQHHIADGQVPPLQLAAVHEHTAVAADGINRHQQGVAISALADQKAPVPYLAAAFAIERRCIEDNLQLVSGSGPFGGRSIDHQGQHAAGLLQLGVAGELGGRQGAGHLLDRPLHG